MPTSASRIEEAFSLFIGNIDIGIRINKDFVVTNCTDKFEVRCFDQAVSKYISTHRSNSYDAYRLGIKVDPFFDKVPL